MTFIKKINIRNSVILGCYVMVPLVSIAYIAGDIRTHRISQPVRDIRHVNMIGQDRSHSLSASDGFWSSVKTIFTRDFWSNKVLSFISNSRVTLSTLIAVTFTALLINTLSTASNYTISRYTKALRVRSPKYRRPTAVRMHKEKFRYVSPAS